MWSFPLDIDINLSVNLMFLGQETQRNWRNFIDHISFIPFFEFRGFFTKILNIFLIILKSWCNIIFKQNLLKIFLIISNHNVISQWEKLYTFRNSFVKVLYKLNRKFESQIHVVKLFPLNFASQKPLQFT